LPTVTVSLSTKMDLLKMGFTNVSILPEGLNFKPLDYVPEKKSGPIILYCGRLKPAKRPDHVILAFKNVKFEFPNAELWVIGDGPFRASLEKISIDGVKFFGSLSNIERRELIKQASLLVNPSIREGWGLNIIEANALGVPTVVYDVPGLRDSVKPEITGLIAQSGNIQDLTTKIIRILKEKDLYQQLCKNALNYSKEFDWDTTAEKFMGILKECS
jgi:glycosyltransferase involved in cell wall biosynthesis